MWSNETTIESWEIDRHKTLLRRARALGGYLDGPHGTRIRIRKQEFPYDIGIYSNLVQALGSNPLAWLWPLASTFTNESGLDFDVNGFEGWYNTADSNRQIRLKSPDISVTWPPPDPDRIPRRLVSNGEKEPLSFEDMNRSDAERLESFKARQFEDLKRPTYSPHLHRRQPFHERYLGEDLTRHSDDSPTPRNSKGEEAWRNVEGENLGDFGVDLDAEFYDEDEVPLAKLLPQRRT